MSKRLIAVVGAVVAGAVVLFSGSQTAVASFYPPNYVVEQTCQSSGPVEVCALNRQYSNYPRVTVRYNGYLLGSQWGRISAFVKVNGRDGTFRMKNANYAESVVVGDPAVRLCYSTKTNGPPGAEVPYGGQYGFCLHTSTPEGGLFGWEADDVPKAEQSVLFYTRNATGQANAWDVSVAFVADDGKWDSRYGQNYNFRFE